MINQSLVEVKSITSKEKRSQFNEQQIEEAARAIVEAKGIINPIILTRTGINSFEVVNGHFEYYAAARAKEIDIASAETIAAYILDGENEAINNQINIFRTANKSTDKTNIVQATTQGNSSNLESRINNLESRLDNRLNELKKEYEQKNLNVAKKIEELNSKLPEKIEPLATFNQANLSELVIKLKPILRSDKTTNDIAEKIVKARPFESLTQVITKTKGLGEKRMIAIIDRWLYSQ